MGNTSMVEALEPRQLFAGAADESVAASVRHLARVMDRYHARFGVYEDVSSAGNHFHAWSKIPDQDASVDTNGSWTDRPHSGATAIRADFLDTPGANFGGF